MSSVMTYRVIDRKTGEIVAEGSGRECAEIVGVRKERISEAAREHGKICGGKYRVERVGLTEGEPKELAEDGIAAAIKRWDDFCQPIRERYGIKVHREEKA